MLVEVAGVKDEEITEGVQVTGRLTGQVNVLILSLAGLLVPKPSSSLTPPQVEKIQDQPPGKRTE